MKYHNEILAYFSKRSRLRRKIKIAAVSAERLME